MSNTVTCNQCGWVHFEVSKKYAEEEVERFNKYYYTLEPETRSEYYSGPSSLDNYRFCHSCNGIYKNFRDSVPNDCPDGCTINPIMSRND